MQMSLALSTSPANQDRPLLMPSPLPSDHSGDREGRMRTLLDLLTIEKMDGLDRTTMSIRSNSPGSRWRILKERLGLRVVGCCGVATCRYSSQESVIDDHNDTVVDDMIANNAQEAEVGTAMQEESQRDEEGMNLGAAEREFRAGEEGGGQATPSRVSLMRLLEETADGGDVDRERRGGGVEEEVVVGSGEDSMCCVCMGRKKGAAFIPCGHTYCRVCSRELWLNRGSCPLCNRRILEVLDIF